MLVGSALYIDVLYPVAILSLTLQNGDLDVVFGTSIQRGELQKDLVSIVHFPRCCVMAKHSSDSSATL